MSFWNQPLSLTTRLLYNFRHISFFFRKYSNFYQRGQKLRGGGDVNLIRLCCKPANSLGIREGDDWGVSTSTQQLLAALQSINFLAWTGALYHINWSKNNRNPQVFLLFFFSALSKSKDDTQLSAGIQATSLLKFYDSFVFQTMFWTGSINEIQADFASW